MNTVMRTFTVSEEPSKKGITRLRVVPLKVSVKGLSDLLSEASRSVVGEMIMVKAVAVAEAPIIGLRLMVVMAIVLLKKLI